MDTLTLTLSQREREQFSSFSCVVNS